MSNLIEQLIEMDEGGRFDALILQTWRQGSNNQFEPHNARAIIRRIRIQTSEFSWAVHGLSYMNGMCASGSGFYGSVDEVCKFAEKWYPSDGNATRWIAMDYANPDFPPNLIPM